MILCDAAAERAVLAGICRYGEDAYLDVADIIQSSTFTVDSNVVIFKILKHICESNNKFTKIDLASIYSAAQDLTLTQQIEKKEEALHLKAILEFPVALDNVRRFAAKIRKLEIARLLRTQLEAAGDKLLDITGNETVTNILGIAEDAIFDFSSLLNDTENHPEEIGKNIDEFLQNLMDNPVDQVGIPTGFPIYDQSIGGGLRKGTVNVIGARPKAQPLSAKLLTPKGWIKMGDVKVGDILVDPDKANGLSKVIGIFPFGKREVFEFTYNDGAKTQACADHQWKAKHKNSNEYEILSYNDIKNRKHNFKDYEFPYYSELGYSPFCTRKLVDIISVGEKDVQCIRVDSESQLYVTDDYVVTKNTGKTLLSDNMGKYIAYNHKLPVLNMDTEMNINDHKYRILAMMTETEINSIESGKFAESPNIKQKIFEAGAELKQCKLFHKTIAGMEFEEQLAIMRRWLLKEVGLDENGHAKPCVIIYDYLKLMDSKGISQDMKEYQVLGFMMTSLHNFAVRYQVPILAFMQLNRDGINAEDTSAASGSDRIIWLCSNFSIFKKKTDEEIAQDGPDNGNRKLIPIVSRHGGGLDNNDYINCHMKGWCAKITEGETHLEILKGTNKAKDGFELKDDNNNEPEIPFD